VMVRTPVFRILLISAGAIFCPSTTRLICSCHSSWTTPISCASSFISSISSSMSPRNRISAPSRSISSSSLSGYRQTCTPPEDESNRRAYNAVAPADSNALTSSSKNESATSEPADVDRTI
tara:strand:- start:96144 stop:96506 length:363 start_codon:yes stop_codon:yes gene_type:complete